ncbi:Undecaprenyl diphosphate synthase [Penicillium subrubescens]|uniref:Undecaprenyl diphosphate synthase n=1 Tax=Penicillium subrubescens TaxID=1316194 RepID=UPI002545B00C|nr:Undecaprenyl diphosphate synthase [Penicillium subrubescens]KAJ5900327.1 Undecaprenyl diphosphate synthase [Penicillium subrubescens]
MAIISRYLERALLATLSYGKVPKHIAMIMDGNRRYARTHNMPIREGYLEGFANAANIIEDLYQLGVSTVSFFMFGVDNFKRDPNEIEDIMKIINDEVGKWVAPGGLAHRLEVCLSHCGERDMLKPDLLDVLDYAMDITRNYRRVKVNLFIAYSGRREIVRGVISTARSQPVPFRYSFIDESTGIVHDEKSVLKPTMVLLKPSINEFKADIMSPGINDLSLEATRRILTHNLWTKDDPSPDIIIRTSGETRLSDYMLWQVCENAQLNFIKCFWPEIRAWHLARIVLGWRMGRTF